MEETTVKTYDLAEAKDRLSEAPARLGACIAMTLLKANNTAITTAHRIPEKWYAVAVVAIIVIIMWKASK